jgi:hypothetical protein
LTEAQVIVRVEVAPVAAGTNVSDPPVTPAINTSDSHDFTGNPLFQNTFLI